MRKGSLSADARLRTFEKGMFCCKLTVAGAIQKGLLHVSFVAAKNCCRGMLKKGFSLWGGLVWAEKNSLFRKLKTLSFVKNLSNCTRKPPFCTNLKPSICTSLSFLSSNTKCFYKPKAFYLHKPFRIAIPSNSFLPSASHSHPAITLLSAKNTAILFISALNPYAVTPERRTDSKPFRRRFARKTGFGSCRRKLPLKSSPAEL